jgi:hypothetical protein
MTPKFPWRTAGRRLPGGSALGRALGPHQALYGRPARKKPGLDARRIVARYPVLLVQTFPGFGPRQPVPGFRRRAGGGPAPGVRRIESQLDSLIARTRALCSAISAQCGNSRAASTLQEVNHENE